MGSTASVAKLCCADFTDKVLVTNNNPLNGQVSKIHLGYLVKLQ